MAAGEPEWWERMMRQGLVGPNPGDADYWEKWPVYSFTPTMIPFKRLEAHAKSPTRNHDTDAGMDLYALEDCVVPSLFNKLWIFIKEQLKSLFTMNKHKSEFDEPILATKVKTGIALEIPIGMYGLILDRSSMGSKLIKGLAGVIDSGYRGDVTVCLANLSFHDYHIKAGDKVAQIVFHKYEALQPYEVEELTPADRGEKGFGSSGA
jgi:dUTP pyrophosphatase